MATEEELENAIPWSASMAVSTIADVMNNAYEERDRIIRQFVSEMAPQFMDRISNEPFDQFLASDRASGLAVQDVLRALRCVTVTNYNAATSTFRLIPINPSETTPLSDDKYWQFIGFFHEEPDDRMGTLARDVWGYNSLWREFANPPYATKQ